MFDLAVPLFSQHADMWRGEHTHESQGRVRITHVLLNCGCTHISSSVCLRPWIYRLGACTLLLWLEGHILTTFTAGAVENRKVISRKGRYDDSFPWRWHMREALRLNMWTCKSWCWENHGACTGQRNGKSPSYHAREFWLGDGHRKNNYLETLEESFSSGFMTPFLLWKWLCGESTSTNIVFCTVWETLMLNGLYYQWWVVTDPM